MRRIILTSLPVAAVMSFGVSAQHHPMGFIDGWNAGSGSTSFFHGPNSVAFAEGDFLNRIDTDDYFAWGRDPVVDSSYGTWCLVGVQFLLADPDVLTAESPAWITGWTEDPAKPNFPDVPGFDVVTGGSNFLLAGPVPANQFPVAEWAFTFSSPVCVVTEGDIFLGTNIGPVGSGEGLFLAGTGDSAAPVPNLSVWDDPGPAASGIAEESYVCVVPTETVMNQLPLPTGADASYIPYLAQNYFEVYMQNASGGVCTATTNQPSFDVSGPLIGNGTTNFLSGVHPDASSLPKNPGRNQPLPFGWPGDQIGFVYSDHRLSAGDPVCVGVAFQLAGTPTPMNMLAGTGLAPTGQLLFDFADLVPLGAGIAMPVSVPQIGLSYSRFAFTIDLPQSSRDLLQTMHPVLLWQGFGLDSSTGNVHATGVARQHF